MTGQLLVLAGSLLILLSAMGVVRFGDVLARLHALTKASTAGLVLVLGGAALVLDDPNDWTFCVLAAVLQILTSPVASLLLGRAAHQGAQAAEAAEAAEGPAPGPVVDGDAPPTAPGRPS